LQKSSLDGRKFRRQVSIGGYIVDFYCPSEELIIELDGEVHNTLEAREYDEERTKFFNALKLRVIRFENWEVEKNLDRVLNCIKSKFNKRS
jgi:very-short-patch-repair endonuclease